MVSQLQKQAQGRVGNLHQSETLLVLGVRVWGLAIRSWVQVRGSKFRVEVAVM